MIKLLVLLSISIGINASNFLLDVKIEDFLFSSPGKTFENTNHAGSIKAPSFHIKSNDADIVLKRNKFFKADIYISPKKLILETDILQMSYSLKKIAPLLNVNELILKNYSLLTNNDRFHIRGDLAKFSYLEHKITLKNVNLKCLLEHNIVDAGDELADACINWLFLSKDKRQEITQVEYSNESMAIKANVEDIAIVKNDAKLDINKFLLFSKDLTIDSDFIGIRCLKEIYTTKTSTVKMITKCLEKAKLRIPQINIRSITKEGKTIFSNLEIETFFSNGKRLRFFGPHLYIESDDFRFDISNINSFCKLPVLDENFKFFHMSTSCLNSSSISFDSFTFFSDPANFKLGKTALNFKEDEVKLVSPSINVTYSNNTIDIKEIHFKCKKNLLTNEWTTDQLIEGCFLSSKGGVKNFKMTDQDTKVIMEQADLNVKSNELALSGPLISYESLSGSLKVDVFDLNIKCSRNREKKRTVEGILRGCFDSSKIDIPKISIRQKDIKSKIEVQKINIDKNHLFFKSPKGEYVLNGFLNRYKNLEFSCQLDASFDLAKNLDWEPILENCLHHTVFKLDELIKKYNGGGIGKKAWDKIKRFGIKAISDVNFNSKEEKNTDFHLRIRPRFLVWLPINVSIKGHIYYKKSKKQIKIKVNKTRIYKIIPAKFFVQMILKAFVADDNIVVDDDNIFINLPKNEDKEN